MEYDTTLNTQPCIYIVVPCYNEECVLEETTKQLHQVIILMLESKLISEDSKIAYVNDGSRDRTWELIKELNQKYKEVCGICLSKNFGHQNALMAGMSSVCESADAVITIDADLQDDITVIVQMVVEFLKGADVVCGVRKERKTDTFFKRTTAQAFYKMMKKLGVNTVYNHADYRLMSKRAVNQLLKFRERNLFLRGIVPLIGYKTTCVYYDRQSRFAGESKYPLSKMLNFAIDGITSFSVRPLRFLVFLGGLFILLSLGVVCWIAYALLTHNAVSGWASLMVSIWFVGGSVLIGLGVVGEYIGKIYLEVKDRPRFIIDEIVK